ncbi:MAG: dipicolinate synthase subunit B [Clostridiales bacterium]|nr:dipicolinate synthase subunit B [Clostridiales bacterium]
MRSMTFGFAMCGSFCTFSKAIDELKKIAEAGFDILPIMSQNAYSTDTRFGPAAEFIQNVEEICGKKIIKSIVEAEPIGPKKMADLMIVAPCTGNTLAKIANGITDTSVTMAVKSTLRVGRPVLLAPATNDALAASAQNIGKLLNTKNIYFVPMRQDDPVKKPFSVVADFQQVLPAAMAALENRQIRPVFL